MSRTKIDFVVGLLIFGLTLFIFASSRVHWVSDSQFTMLLSQSLLEHQSFTLDRYTMPRHVDDAIMAGELYQLEVVGDHLYYYFPPGTSVLSVPFVAVANFFGISAVTSDGAYDPQGEEKIQYLLAAVLMATLAVVFFSTSRLLLPPAASAVVALGGALGTQVWSTASRAMWSHTWEILLLGLVIWMLLAREAEGRKLRPVLLGSLLSWMYFVRPTSSIAIAAISVYIFLYHRRAFVPYALTGAVWLAGFVGYSWYHFGRMWPSYYRAGRLDYSDFWTAFAGNLISPSRGLLVYVPVLVFIVYVLARYRKEIVFPRLAVLASVTVAGHLVVIAGFSPWNGGHCYGPRLTTDLVPWFVLLGLLGLKAMSRWREERSAKTGALRWRATLALGGLLLLLSAFINGRGATSAAAARWNVWPVSMSFAPERVWDWTDPQFLAGIIPTPEPPPPSPTPAPAVQDWQTLLDADPIHLLDHTDWSQTVYRMHKAASGRMPRYAEFVADMRRIGRGVRAGAEGQEQVLAKNLRAFAEELIGRAPLRQSLDDESHERYVGRLFSNAGVAPEEALRAALVKGLDDGAETRATVLLKVAGEQKFVEKEHNPSLVLLHFFAYLRRDPDAPPDGNMRGFFHWVQHLEKYGAGAELSTAFAVSIERQELTKSGR